MDCSRQWENLCIVPSTGLKEGVNECVQRPEKKPVGLGEEESGMK